MVSTKFTAQLTTDDQLTFSRVDPPMKRHACWRPLSPEHLMRNIVVKDGAHD